MTDSGDLVVVPDPETTVVAKPKGGWYAEVLTARMSDAVRMCLANIAAYGKPSTPKVARLLGISDKTVRWALSKYRTGKRKLRPQNQDIIQDIKKYGFERDMAMTLKYTAILEQLIARLLPAAATAVRPENFDPIIAIEATNRIKPFVKELKALRKGLKENEQTAALISPSILVQTNVQRNGCTETHVTAIERHGGSALEAILGSPIS